MTVPNSQYDLIIVGSGGASMCAALAARSLNQTSVILEKLDKVGGSTGYSGGVWWVPNNPLLARAGVHDSFELARQYVDAVVPYEGPATSAARRDMFLRVAPKMVEFLEKLGMKFYWADGWPDYYDDLPGGAPRGRCLMAEIFDIRELGEWQHRLSTYAPFLEIPAAASEAADLMLAKRTWRGKRMLLKLLARTLSGKIRGKRLVTNGAAIQGRMLQLALRAGIPIFTETTFLDLILDDGRVVGIVAMHKGSEIKIFGRNVLLNAGGFARNGELREQYQPQPTAYTNANPGDTGEVLLSAMRHGAATAAMDAAVWVSTSRSTNGTWPEGAISKDGKLFPFMHNFDLAKPFAMIVDADGERYMNEAASYVEVGERQYQRHQRTGKAIPSWMIMDGRFLKYYGLASSAPGIRKQWLDSGYLVRGESLEELAQKCGIDVEGLLRTTRRFNTFAVTGVDLQFNRGRRQYDRYRGDPTVHPNPCLGPIEKPPFCAIALYPGDVGTTGGIVTDEFGRALREDGSPIAGLYAAGNCAASVFGHTYPGAGASIAHSFVFGFIAAHHAVGAHPLEDRSHA